MSPELIVMYFMGAIGTVAIFYAAYSLMYQGYDEIETKTLQGISEYAAEIYSYLDRMYKRQPMNKCYLIIVVPTIVLGLFGLAVGLLHGIFLGFVMAMVFTFVGYKLPGAIIRGVFQRRVAKFDRQLVDALNMMANAIKSGLSFMQVVQVIEREMPKPCSEEFAMVLKENRVGVNLNDALMNMTKRVPSEDLFMIMNSVVTLSQQGGDLSEAFDTIAQTIRERQRVFEKIRTLAQAGITQGIILSCLPFVMLGMQYIIQPNYFFLLFTTPLGLSMFAMMIILMVLGALWMRKILTIEV